MIPLLILKMNSFHLNISLIYEKENNNKLLLLDVLFIRIGTRLDATVYRKDTHNYLYLYWDAFIAINWKQGTLRTLVNRASLICSSKELLHKKLAYLRLAFLLDNKAINKKKKKKKNRRKPKAKGSP